MKSRHLLLVDDDPQMEVLVGLLARRSGLTVFCRPDVDSAWSAVLTDRPELVLLDVNLPIKSGLDFLRRRQQTPAPHRFSVALFSQPAMTHDLAAGWREGADYLLSKELVTRAADWKNRVAEILEHARGQAAVPSLGCVKEKDDLLLSRWGEVLNEALDHPSLRSLVVEVIEQVLARALVSGFGSEAVCAWLAPEAGRVALPTPVTGDSSGVYRCFDSCIDQVWRLLGPGPCAQFAVALRSTVNAVREQER
jgi:DNA-binding response OmpR family regulator